MIVVVQKLIVREMVDHFDEDGRGITVPLIVEVSPLFLNLGAYERVETFPTKGEFIQSVLDDLSESFDMDSAESVQGIYRLDLIRQSYITEQGMKEPPPIKIYVLPADVEAMTSMVVGMMFPQGSEGEEEDERGN